MRAVKNDVKNEGEKKVRVSVYEEQENKEFQGKGATCIVVT